MNDLQRYHLNRYGFIMLCLFFVLPVRAQQPQRPLVEGRTVLVEDDTALTGVNILLISLADTTRRRGLVSDSTGAFRFIVPTPGAYQVRFSYVGFQTQTRRVDVQDAPIDLGLIRMVARDVLLDSVVVEARQDRVVVRGDTTEYNADAYKVNPDATAEDLVAKMPGIVVQDGQVQAQGETVRRVLVDGREFFGDDPNAALRNLPSEIIDKIEVFEKLSDQAAFTGFDDGNREMTINIVTRQGRSNGQFGKAYGGYGSENRYIGGGNVNIFDDARRISVIGLSNNVNQQNFTTEDLLGVVGAAGGRGGGGFRGAGGRGGGGRGGRGGGRGSDGGGFQGAGQRSDPSNFQVGNQGGVNTTTAFGVNYIDTWASRIRVTGSYFFNASDNASDVLLDRQYYLTDTASQFYNETNAAGSDNDNHRATLRLQYDLDDNNSFIFTPRISTQRNASQSFLEGVNTLDGGALLSRTINNFFSDNSGFTSSGNLLWRHRFSKTGRTFSANVSAGLNDRSGTSDLLAENTFYDDVTLSLLVDQRTRSTQDGVTLGSRLAYTEPVGEAGQLQLSYTPSVDWSSSERLANTLDTATGTYSILDPLLSNTYDNTTTTQRAGVSYRHRIDQYTLMAGVNVQAVELAGDQAFPIAFETQRTFRNVLPTVMLQYRSGRAKNVRIFYRTSTSTPSVTQLQDVIDNTNPLQLTGGNPDLKQSFTHTMMLRFNQTNAERGTVFIGFVSASQSNDYIGSASLIAEEDQLLADGVVLAQGSQFSQPVNLDGYWNARSFFTFGVPLSPLKSNLNLNAGYAFARTPGLINAVRNTAGVHTVNGGAVLGSNISEAVDFTLSYALSYNVVRNTVYPELDANYAYHRSAVRVNLLPWKTLVLNTSVGFNTYQGLGDGFDQTALVWNAALGYKILKGNTGEIRLMVSDILNQNNNVTRTVNEFYVEDNVTNVLGRYLMLNFTYTLRNFRI